MSILQMGGGNLLVFNELCVMVFTPFISALSLQKVLQI